jgi:hypothetical protein
MTTTIKNLRIVVFLLLFTYPIFGMTRDKIRKRSTLPIQFAEEVNQNEHNKSTNIQELFFAPKKRENGPCPPLVCILCTNCMVAGACSLALAAVVYFANPEAASQSYEYVNKTT